MRFRTLALALALSCPVMTAVGAAQRPAPQRVKPRKAKKARKPANYKAHKAPKVKPRKHF